MIEIGQQPLVSIITPVYNGAEYLDDLIQSVLQQDYPNVEHIIIDDGSTDDGATVAILKRYPHLRWWSRENKGQYATQNEGLAAAQGEIVSVISADDMYVTPSAISSVVSHWQAHPELGAVYGWVDHIDGSGAHLPVQARPKGRFPIWFLRYHLFIAHCSLFIAKKILASEGVWFDPSLRYAGDWDWIIRLSKTGYKIGYLDQLLGLYRCHESQVTHTANADTMLQEKRMVARRYGGNYDVTLAIGSVFNCRAMVLKAIYALRMGGISNLHAVVQDWRRQRGADRGTKAGSYG